MGGIDPLGDIMGTSAGPVGQGKQKRKLNNGDTINAQYSALY